MERERGTGNEPIKRENEGGKKGKNQTMCYEVADRARVQVRFSTHLFIFSFSVHVCRSKFQFLAPRFSNIPTRPELKSVSFQHEMLIHQEIRITPSDIKCRRYLGIPVSQCRDPAVSTAGHFPCYQARQASPLNKTSNRRASGKILLMRTTLKALM